MKKARRSRNMFLSIMAVILGLHFAKPIYDAYKYAHIYGPAIVKLLGNQGGGTGFQIEYNGRKVIMTNDHVCALANENGMLLADSPFADLQPVFVRYRSQYTDLCIVSPVKELPALSLGSHELEKGDSLGILGHPRLGKLHYSPGYVTKIHDIDVMLFPIDTPSDALRCTLPKHKKIPIFFGIEWVCAIHVRAEETSALIEPGNSGSPVLNKWGHVVGVAFAAGADKRAAIIPFKELKRFLDGTLKSRPVSRVH